MPEDQISAALYAIYAFQLSVFPLIVFSILFPRNLGINSLAAIISTMAGLLTAWFSSTSGTWLFGRWLEADSIYVIPPLAVIVVSSATFAVLNAALARK